MGVAVRDWVTWHGAYLNVSSALGLFRLVERAALHEVLHRAGAAHERGRGVVADPELPFVAVGDVERERTGFRDAEFLGERGVTRGLVLKERADLVLVRKNDIEALLDLRERRRVGGPAGVA